MIVAHALGDGGLSWTSWSFDAAPLVILFVAAVIYALGAASLGRRLSRPRVLSFYLGLVTIALALGSPLDHASSEIFSAHMVQHLLLMLVAPPLIVLGRPIVVLGAGAPRRLGRAWIAAERTAAAGAARRFGSSGLAVLGLNVLVLWAWHLPTLYEAALSGDAMHALEHGSFIGAALAFWNLVLGKRARRPGDIGRTMAVTFGNLLQSGALGAILVFAESPLYPSHGIGARSWEMTALQDQQLAGALMWVPAGFVYIGTMAYLFLRWLKAMDLADSPRSEVVEADA